MKTRKMFIVPFAFFLAGFSCSQNPNNHEPDPSRACTPEMTPDGDRAEALERLLRGDRKDNACYKEFPQHGGKFQ